jgi:hypothetical protein
MPGSSDKATTTGEVGVGVAVDFRIEFQSWSWAGAVFRDSPEFLILKTLVSKVFSLTILGRLRFCAVRS